MLFFCSKEQLGCSEFFGCAELGCENKWNKNVETDGHDKVYQESNAEMDHEETIDMID